MSERADFFVLIECPTCGEITGPVWPNPAYPLVPEVVHQGTGGHLFRTCDPRATPVKTGGEVTGSVTSPPDLTPDGKGSSGEAS